MSVSSLRAQDLAGLDPKWRQALLGVSAHGVLLPPNGKLHLVDAGGPDTLVQTAVDTAVAGDVILIGPGEYDEDVTITTGQLTLIGAGPRHSVRITGTAVGTATAMTITGVDDVALYNLNLEGRSGGGGLVVNDVARRISVVGCRMHGGDAAASLVSDSSSVGWVTFDDCEFASAASGLSVTNSGGGITQQVRVQNSLFWSISADCIVQSGFSQNWVIDGNVFASDAGTEPTQFLDIDDASTSGFVSNNVFHTTVFSTAKFAIASGVLFANNISEAENPSANVGGTSGRPDA